MNKLFETVDSLEEYIFNDEKEEITIKEVCIVDKDNYLYNLDNLPEKSLKLFKKGNLSIGYLYFKDIVSSKPLSLDYSLEDNNILDLILIKYVNGGELCISIDWNSMCYELDNGYYIFLFTGEEL